jgi:hypothetical protein
VKIFGDIIQKRNALCAVIKIKINKLMKDEKEIYQSEEVVIISPLKSRIFNDNFQRIESYNEEGKKIILFIKKEKE